MTPLDFEADWRTLSGKDYTPGYVVDMPTESGEAAIWLVEAAPDKYPVLVRYQKLIVATPRYQQTREQTLVWHQLSMKPHPTLDAAVRLFRESLGVSMTKMRDQIHGLQADIEGMQREIRFWEEEIRGLDAVLGRVAKPGDLDELETPGQHWDEVGFP